MNFNSLKDNYLSIIKTKYVNFDGRARRSEFWQFVLANVIVSFVLGLIPVAGVILSSLYSLGIMLPSLGVVIRRLKDLDKPWAWIFLMCVPLANFYLIYLLAQEGTKGDNQFGPDPKAGDAPAAE